MELTGVSFLGNRRGSRDGSTFHAFNPQTGATLPPAYHAASSPRWKRPSALRSGGICELFAGFRKDEGRIPAPRCRRL